MKKAFKPSQLFVFVIITIWVFYFTGCKKDNNNNKENNSEVLIEANNNKALGKYSGILVGSSGYYSIELRTSGSKATVVFDGKTYILAGQGAIEAGKTVTNYILQKDDIKITFSVDADGKNPKAKFEIPGHQVHATINKETTVYNTVSYIGKIRDSINGKDIEPAALTISNNAIVGFAKMNTDYVSISGQRVDTTANLRITFSNNPSKFYNAKIDGTRITGGSQYIFNLSQVK